MRGRRRIKKRELLWLKLLFGVLCGGIVGAGSLNSPSAGAASAEGDELYIIANVQDQELVNGQASRSPVAGVSISVTDPAGTLVGEAATGDDGLAKIRVPVKADYIIIIDTSTLPEGLALIDETKSRVTIDRELFTTSTKRVSFFTGQATGAGATQFEKVMQRLSDGIRLGLIIAMCSVGLSLVFGTTGLTNFAHGELVTFGGLTAFYFNVTLEIPILISGPVVVLLGGLFGLLYNWAIFARLTKRGVGLISQLVVTVGLSILLRNVYLFQFGGRTKQLASYAKQTNIRIGPVGITPRDLTTAVLGVIILVSVALFLQRSRLGKAIRAVSDNVSLASATGIDTRKVIRIVWFAGGALAAVGGIFRGLDEQVGFQMGSDLLFLMFAGITLGGLGSAFGALIGGFFVGIFVEMSSLWFPTELKAAPALFILILVLIVRPQGILGKSQRVG